MSANTSLGANFTKLNKVGSSIRTLNVFEDSDLTEKITPILEEDLKSTGFKKTVTISKNKMIYSTSKNSLSEGNTSIQKQSIDKITENIHISLRKKIGNIL